jgi:hypothetical protein
MPASRHAEGDRGMAEEPEHAHRASLPRRLHRRKAHLLPARRDGGERDDAEEGAAPADVRAKEASD